MVDAAGFTSDQLRTLGIRAAKIQRQEKIMRAAKAKKIEEGGKTIFPAAKFLRLWYPGYHLCNLKDKFKGDSTSLKGIPQTEPCTFKSVCSCHE